jgi:hypothetical protein
MSLEREADKSFQIGFIILYGFFSIYHFLTDPFQYFYLKPLSPFTVLGILMSLLVILRPTNLLYFVSLLLTTLFHYVLKAPIGSNHTIILSFLILALLGTLLWAQWENFDWSFAIVKFIRIITPLLYFFAAFHKLNYDYFDSDLSCSIHLLRDLPFGEIFLRIPNAFLIVAIGSILIETLLCFLLIVPRFNAYGVAIGIPFHCLLAFSGTAFFGAFSSLCFLFLYCFFPIDHVQKFASTQIGSRVLNTYREYPLLLGAFAIFLISSHILIFMIWSNSYTVLILPWFIFAFCFSSYSFLACNAGWGNEINFSIPRSLNSFYSVLVLLFVFNAICPYLGLKTKQSLSMFSNLNTSGGISNHMLISWSPGPFEYTSNYVTVHEAYDPRSGSTLNFKDETVIYYQFLDFFERHPHLQFSFTNNSGEKFESIVFSDLKVDAGRILHSRLFRKWFHFEGIVKPGEGTPCLIVDSAL